MFVSVNACEKDHENGREMAAKALLNLPSPSSTAESKAYLQAIVQQQQQQQQQQHQQQQRTPTGVL